VEQEAGSKPSKNWFARHKILTGVLIFIVLAIIGGASGGGNKSQQQAPPASSDKSSQARPTPKSEYAVAEPAAIDDQVVTLTKVTRNYSTGNAYAKPESGKEFVAVEVKIENNGSSQIDFNTFDFQMQDSNGTLRNIDLIVGLDSQLNSGNLAPGGKVVGNLGFQVPKGDAGLKLVFKPTFWSNRTVTFKL
jgi:hypothetical protein